MATLSERIGILADAADQLRADVKKLRLELNERDGIESIQHLADVPGDLERAEALMRNVYSALELAQQDAVKGGQ